MRLRIFLFALFLNCMVLSAPGQDKQDRVRFEVPREVALPVVASQPDSPVQFEDVRFLARVGGGSGGADFKLRNRSSKPIRSLSYAVWLSNNTGWTNSWPGRVTHEIVQPGQLVPLSAEKTDEIIPLTDEKRKELKWNGGMKVVIVFMILKVEFTDGSTYNDELRFKALEEYFSRISECSDP